MALKRENDIQFLHGAEANRSGVTPNKGEPVWTEGPDPRLYVGDGVTVGGKPVCRSDSYITDLVLTKIEDEGLAALYAQLIPVPKLSEPSIPNNTVWLDTKDILHWRNGTGEDKDICINCATYPLVVRVNVTIAGEQHEILKGRVREGFGMVNAPLDTTTDITIDWGDITSIDTYTGSVKPTHTYNTIGEYDITITGHVEQVSFSKVDTIIEIKKWGKTGLTVMENMFKGATNLVTISATDGDNLKNVTNFKAAWRGCYNLTNFPIINVENGTDFTAAWYGCRGLTSFPLLDFTSATNFTSTWQMCAELTSFEIGDISTVTNFSSTWMECSKMVSFSSLNSMSGVNFNSAWKSCTALEHFGTILDVSNSVDMSVAWCDCTSLQYLPIISTPLTDAMHIRQMLSNCTSLVCIKGMDTSGRIGAYYSNANIFDNCTSLVQPDSATQLTLDAPDVKGSIGPGGHAWTNLQPCP